MARRGPAPATWRRCLSCNAPLVRGEDENSNVWHHRQICQTQACWEAREQQKVAALAVRPNLAEMREIKPWPEGVRFGSLDLPSTVTKVTHPETHVPRVANS